MPRLRTASGIIAELSDRSCSPDSVGSSMVKCTDPMDLRPADQNSLLRTTIREFTETEAAFDILASEETGSAQGALIVRKQLGRLT